MPKRVVFSVEPKNVCPQKTAISYYLSVFGFLFFKTFYYKIHMYVRERKRQWSGTDTVKFHILPKTSKGKGHRHQKGHQVYRKNRKNSDVRKICCNHPKIWTTRLYHTVMLLKDADGIANSVDPDETAPLGPFWSGSALFVQAYLPKNLGSL